MICEYETYMTKAFKYPGLAAVYVKSPLDFPLK